MDFQEKHTNDLGDELTFDVSTWTISSEVRHDKGTDLWLKHAAGTKKDRLILLGFKGLQYDLSHTIRVVDVTAGLRSGGSVKYLAAVLNVSAERYVVMDETPYLRAKQRGVSLKSAVISAGIVSAVYAAALFGRALDILNRHGLPLEVAQLLQSFGKMDFTQITLPFFLILFVPLWILLNLRKGVRATGENKPFLEKVIRKIWGA